MGIQLPAILIKPFFSQLMTLQECMGIQLPAAGVYGDTTPSDLTRSVILRLSSNAYPDVM
jgi:hypothetical protein